MYSYDPSALVFALVISALLALIPAKIAKDKGHSFGGYWCLSFFLSFLIGLIVVVFLNDRTRIPHAEQGRPARQNAPRGNAPEPAEPAGTHAGETSRFCQSCGSAISDSAVFCHKCGTKIQ